MASATSLGIHRPSALPFLVAEGILPTEPSPELYDWKIVSDSALGSSVLEEELLTTEQCVVWSRGGTIEKVFRFDVEKESVNHALFTHFYSQDSFQTEVSKSAIRSKQSDQIKELNGLGRNNDGHWLPGSDIFTDLRRSAVLDDNKGYSVAHGFEGYAQKQRSSSRALVIILKTHAQIFFLAGASHIVHLPFEVDRAFPLSNGLLLQRKPSPSTVLSSPIVPAVPQNSFTFEALASSATAHSSQNHHSLDDLRKNAHPNLPFLPMLNSLLQHASNTTADAGIPRLYCLKDPFNGVGAVVTQRGQYALRDLRNRNIPDPSAFDDIDPSEKLIFVSQSEDARKQNTEGDHEPPILLAVTQHQESLEYSVWSVEHVDDRFSSSAIHQRASEASGRPKRRRSSYGKGTNTGANTPVARVATAGRESFGGSMSRSSVGRDLLSEDSFNGGGNNLVSHLDSALDNPSAPVKSSRRVSSLLARADLSSTQDKTTFSDLATGYPASTTARKGTSFGSHGVRLSSGSQLGTNLLRSQQHIGPRTSIEPATMIDSHEVNGEDGFDEDTASDNSKNSSLHHHFRHLRKEIIFIKINTIAPEKGDSYSAHRSKEPRILLLKPPAHVVRAEAEETAAFLCIVHRSAASLLIVSIRSRLSFGKRQEREPGIEAPTSKQRPRRRNYWITGSSRSNGVIDACNLRDNDCSRLLVLRRSSDNGEQLFLQDPWGPQIAIQLPLKLSLHNPYQFVNLFPPKHRRDGSLKRILSQGPENLVGINHGGNRGTADLVDAGGSRHRVEIQLQPRNPFLRTMLRLCDSILLLADNEEETILNGWWHTMVWLSARSDIEGDLEWTAFVVVISSIAAGLVEDRRTETMARQKKRKSGLLRSSSGANTNMESWEAMLVEESGVLCSVPGWMQDEAWTWTSKQAKVSKPMAAVSRKPRSSGTSLVSTIPAPKKSPYFVHCMSLARDLRSSLSTPENVGESFPFRPCFQDSNSQRMALAKLLVGLHLLREEYKLNILTATPAHELAPLLAQVGTWLGWPSWSSSTSTYYMLESADMEHWLFDNSPAKSGNVTNIAEPFQPPSIMQFIEAANLQPPSAPFISLLEVVGYQHVTDKSSARHGSWAKELVGFTPRTVALNGLLINSSKQSLEARVAEMTSWGWSLATLETLPEGVAVSFRSNISNCQAQPVAGSNDAVLDIIGRDDINIQKGQAHCTRTNVIPAVLPRNEAIHDIHSICTSTLDVDTVGAYDGTTEADRQSTSRMVFKVDQRFAEAAKLLHPLHAPVARCVPEPEWSDTELLEAQQELAKTIAMRTLAVSPGRSCLFYSARLPLLTEKFPIHGFTLSCVMKPSNTTVTADKLAYTEEKVSWAFFHAGVEAGLSIAKGAKGIDTSWILFNKPQELKNRHAGFLLALGLNGHLKSIAKWVAFKYLTPKHTMTSIGLLLGLAASHLGTMDTLVTRLLSVHVTRMLPPGAAELNLSSLTQTSGIMGIGLLYCGTQHRRMSEIMLSEMENAEDDDSSSPHDSLRDEGYRLAAGFALGYINLARGKDLKGLHDMHIVERLLALAIGTKKVTLVHILDKATAAATISVALVFMKTHDEVIARKVDIPDTVHQFEYVRPDVFLLRTVARHLIMWNDIHASTGWIRAQLPVIYQHKAKLDTIRTLSSDEMPFFNIIAGLCLAIGLRHAGTGFAEVRNLLCHYLDQFIRICRLPILNYDGKLTHITVRNCQDVVALAAACVMAGTGDLHVFRRLRSLHGRVEVDIPYGSHLAAHLAIGVLFLGGGTYTFGTSDLAVASLLCAFYPLFPASVLDNKSHLQAFRHFWVFAAEARCVVVYDIDTRRPISVPVLVTLRSGLELSVTAPCLLPELNTVARIQTNDPEYWSVVLDLANNPSDHQTFRYHRGIWVRRRAAYDLHLSIFSATMQALNDAQTAHTLSKHIFEWVFNLETFRNFDTAELALVLPPDLANIAYKSTRGSVVDDRLVFETACMKSGWSERLWNLRILFAWADALSKRGGQWGWIGKEVIGRLKTRLTMLKMKR